MNGNRIVCILTALFALQSNAQGVANQRRELKQGEPEFCVVLNEIVNKPVDFGDQKGVDFIEFKNDCEEAIDMANWRFLDENLNEFVMGQDGCEHVVGPLAFFVLFRKSECSFDFGFTSTDNVTLMDGSGLQMDYTEWQKGQADEGFSWSRIPDGRGYFQTGLPTPGVENVPA